MEMAHSAPRTRVSDMDKEFNSFLRIRDSSPPIAPKSPFVPRTWPEWVAHRLAMDEQAHRDEMQRLSIREAEQRNPSRQQLKPIFAGKVFNDDRSSVLSNESIWIPPAAIRNRWSRAPWPSIDELKHEGHDRNLRGDNRLFPQPRERRDISVNWKDWPLKKPLRFDDLTRDDSDCDSDDDPVSDHDMEVNYPPILLGPELLQELNIPRTYSEQWWAKTTEMARAKR